MSLKHKNGRVRWPTRGRVTATRAALICLCALLLGYFCARVYLYALVPDWAWLHATGVFIRHHGLVPTHALFTTDFGDHTWTVYQWLFEVIASAVYDALGATASVITFLILGLTILVWVPVRLAIRRDVPPLFALTIACLAAVPACMDLQLRPMVVSAAGLLITFTATRSWRDGGLSNRTVLIGLPIVFMVWANMHMGVVFGLLSLSFFTIEAATSSRRGMPGTSRYAALLALCALATLATPYGIHLFYYLLSLSLKTRMNAYIGELHGASLGIWQFDIGAFLMIGFLASQLRTLHRYRTSDWLHIGFFTLLGVYSLRFALEAGLCYALILPEGLWQALTGRWPNYRTTLRTIFSLPEHHLSRAGLAAPLLVACLCPAVIAGPAVDIHCQRVSPALSYVDAHFPGSARILTTGQTGSCMLAQLPQRRALIDTRFDMYPESYVVDVLRLKHGKPGWRHFLRETHPDGIVIPIASPVLASIVSLPGYKRVFSDQWSTVIKRRQNVVSRVFEIENYYATGGSSACPVPPMRPAIARRPSAGVASAGRIRVFRPAGRATIWR